MITQTNASKTPSTGVFVDVEKLIGVGSINVVAINPNNAKLRQFGWNIPEDQEEPKYVIVDNDGKKSARVRFLVQVDELKEKNIVSVDFWVRPEVRFNSDSSKCQIIDPYGRTAWGTKQEVQAHKIPEYQSGPASISSNYKPCHVGEEELIQFLLKYLNITPLQMMKDGNWVATKNPGTCTIDNWQAICDGNVRELAEYISSMPENRCKICFGVRTTDDNKTYQTFLSSQFFGNGIRVGSDGEYASVKKAIDKFKERFQNSPVQFSAAPVKKWSVTATEVKEFEGEPLFPDDFKDDLPM